MRRARSIQLHWDQRRQLLALVHSSTTARRVSLRGRIVVRAAQGASNKEIAAELGTSTATAALWRRRFLSHGIAGITQDAPRPGRPHSIPGAKVAAILDSRRAMDPSSGKPPSVRALARRLQISKSTVQRIRRSRQGARPPGRTSGPTPGPLGFLETVTDLVGLYLHPPGRAVAFATDERLSAPPSGRPPSGPRLLPARRNPAAEFRAFLQRTDRETPRVFEVHLLIDSRMLPIPREVHQWLSRHPRFHFHFLPSDRSGLTVMDRLIDGFTQRKERPGVSPGAHRLKNALREHLRRNRDPLASFEWTAASGEIRGAFSPRDIY